MSELPLAISVQGLSRHYGRIQAVKNLNLQVPLGSAFGLIGLNGAGKTTLIKMLVGATVPAQGTIKILDGSPQDLAVRKKLGYLPERLVLPPALTAIGFLRSVGRIKGLRGDTLSRDVEQKLSLVGLDKAAWRRRTGTFSKGMIQRTGLAAALMGDPTLLLLDEPTDGIDPLGRAHIREILQALRAKGTTIFINSHLLSETEKLCQHVAIMHQGRVVQSGSTQTLREQKRFHLRFAEHPERDRIATELGLQQDLEAQARGEQQSYIFAGDDPGALNACLAQAQQRGLLLLELQPMLRALEAVLADALDDADAAVAS